jgi:preprotein translocase subunit SecG
MGKNQRRDCMNRKPKRIDGKAVVLVVIVAVLFGTVLLPAVNAGFALVSGAGNETEPSGFGVLLTGVIGVLTASFAGIGVAALLRRRRRNRQ